jgi:hypothetical protein
MMKLNNSTYDVLRDYTEISHLEAKTQEYVEAINVALNAIHGLVGLNMEIGGAPGCGCLATRKSIKTY